MSFPNNNLNQTAVYWATPTDNGYGGFTWATPAEIDCRWVSTTKVIKESQVRALQGEEVVSRARVQVKQDVVERGMLYLGTLDDLTAAQKADPTTISTAYYILKFDKVPTMKGDKFYREAWL